MKFVYAIGFVKERFVMVRHRDRAWEMPGGRVNRDETTRAAIEREFFEETGMRFIPISSIGLSNGEVFFGTAEGDLHTTSNEILEVALFSELPVKLSFPEVEYKMMIQQALLAVKNYINRDSIGDSRQGD